MPAVCCVSYARFLPRASHGPAPTLRFQTPSLTRDRPLCLLCKLAVEKRCHKPEIPPADATHWPSVDSRHKSPRPCRPHTSDCCNYPAPESRLIPSGRPRCCPAPGSLLPPSSAPSTRHAIDNLQNSPSSECNRIWERIPSLHPSRSISSVFHRPLPISKDPSHRTIQSHPQAAFQVPAVN